MKNKIVCLSFFMLFLGGCRFIYLQNDNLKYSLNYQVEDSLKVIPPHVLNRIDTTNSSTMTYTLENKHKVMWGYDRQFQTYTRVELYGQGKRVHYRYAKSGKVEDVGARYSGVYIGEYTKYGNNGEVLSHLNKDTLFPICWYEAISIAKNHGLRHPISITGNPRNWIVTNEKQLQIAIDNKTGKVLEERYTWPVR